MNSTYTTTGLQQIAIGSVETFQLSADLNGVPWILDGGTVTLTLADPTGAQTTIAATIQGGGAIATWTVAGPVGSWARSWTVIDSIGRKQVSLAIGFAVVSSPS